MGQQKTNGAVGQQQTTGAVGQQKTIGAVGQQKTKSFQDVNLKKNHYFNILDFVAGLSKINVSGQNCERKKKKNIGNG